MFDTSPISDDNSKIQTLRECTWVIFLCCIWYSISATNNIIGKTLLSEFPYPLTVTIIQLISITVYTQPVLKFRKVPNVMRKISWGYWWQMIVPLSIGKFFGAVAGHISIWKVPVSYAHTVKATMPFFVVALSRIILHEKQTVKVYVSLVPIIVGVAIASVTEISFDFLGMISALAAAFCFSMQSIFTKKCMKETSIHHMRLLLVLAQLSTMIFLPLWVIVDLRVILTDTTPVSLKQWQRIVLLLLADGFVNFMQNLVAFTVLACVTPLSYAVANATKRIVIITVSLMLLQNPVTIVNVVGMLTAITGVLLYQLAKFDQFHQERRKQILPLVKSELDLIRLNHHLSPDLRRSNSVMSGELGLAQFNGPQLYRHVNDEHNNQFPNARYNHFGQ